MFHVLRGLALVLGPLVGYIIGRSNEAAFVGLGIAAVVIAVELVIERIPLDTLVFGAIGAFGGVIVARSLDWLIYKMDSAPLYRFVSENSLIIHLFLAYLGCMIAVRKKGELDLLDKNLVVKSPKSKDVKILDTSALIDGRIADVVETGFLSGKLVVPRFVLQELQTVADSSDATKRQRGRRGLDILKRLQDGKEVVVKIYDKDFPNSKDVDSKLLDLAKELDAKLATTDFNLSKVAALQGVSVLNVNDLAGALKSVVLPGDGLTVFMAKDGKEKNQGVGYLDDGTMIVVDDGRRFIGKRIPVHVNSILQTPAGRMIFAKAQEGRDGHADEKSGPAISDIPQLPT